MGINTNKENQEHMIYCICAHIIYNAMIEVSSYTESYFGTINGQRFLFSLKCLHNHNFSNNSKLFSAWSKKPN